MEYTPEKLNIDGLETFERGENMELKVFRDTLSCMNELCACTAEIPIETEILVPDYLPQIFKIVKCFVYPVALKKQVAAGRLTVDGYLRCVVYYQAEEDHSLCQTEQKIPFARTMDLPESEAQNYVVNVSGEVEYLNCRAVNQRRIDIRGAFAMNAVVTVQVEQEIVTALADCGIEQKMLPVSGTKCLLNMDKLITAEEELTLPGQPQAILDISGIGDIEEIKLISGKAVVKGSVQVSVTYRTTAGCDLESTEKSVPFNQIIDMDGIPEDSTCFGYVEMIGCTLTAATGQEGANTLTMTAMLHLRVYRPAECYVVEDAFSTQYTTEVSTRPLQCEHFLEQLDKTAQTQVTGTMPDENAQIIGCFVMLSQPEWQTNAEGLCLGGRAIAHVLCLNSLDEIDCYDKSFEYVLPGAYQGDAADYRLECWPVVTHAEARKEGGMMTVQVSIRVQGLLFSHSKETTVDAVTCEELLENEEPDVALRIYYAQAGENIFEIAKNYHVSPAAMMKLNELEDMQLEDTCRLLVPMTV